MSTRPSPSTNCNSSNKHVTRSMELFSLKILSQLELSILACGETLVSSSSFCTNTPQYCFWPWMRVRSKLMMPTRCETWPWMCVRSKLMMPTRCETWPWMCVRSKLMIPTRCETWPWMCVRSKLMMPTRCETWPWMCVRSKLMMPTRCETWPKILLIICWFFS